MRQCQHIDLGHQCEAPAAWLIEGQVSAGPFEFAVASEYERHVCGEPDHVFETVVELTARGVSPVLVSEWVDS